MMLLRLPRLLTDRPAALLPLLFVAVEMVGLTLHPLAWSDEPLLNDPALQLIRTGTFRSDVLKSFPFYERFYFWQPPGLALVTAVSYLLFGFGLWQTRIMGILFGALAVAGVQHLATRCFGNRRAGFFAAVLLMVWPPFVATARAARMDTACLAFLLFATAALLSQEHDNPDLRRSALAGLLTGLAGMMHSVALPWLLGLLAVQAMFLNRKLARLLTFGVVSTLPATIWFGFALRFPQEFRAQFLFQVAGRTAQGGLGQRLFAEVRRCVQDNTLTPLLFPALIVTAIALWRWRHDLSEPARRLLLLTLVTFAGVTLLGGKVSGYYGLYYMVPTVILIAGATDRWLADIAANTTVRRLAITCSALFLLNCAVKVYVPRLIAVTVQADSRDYDTAFAPLVRLLHPADQVWGSGECWYACVRAGARLEIAPGVVPIKGDSRPDPKRHRFVVVSDSRFFPLDGFCFVAAVDRPLTPFLGRSFSNAAYRYEIWQSEQLQLSQVTPTD